MSELPFKPFVIGRADFANGEAFQIDQVKPTGACRITDLNTKVESFAHNVCNAWKSVMFKARLDERTQNTSRWRG